MANLRILGINAADSRSIKVKFSNDLSLKISEQNVSVKSMDVGVPDVVVQSVDIFDDILVLNTLPMTPYAKYKVTFASTPGIPFISKNTLDILVEEGNLNSTNILGAEDPNNVIRDELIIGLGGAESPYDFTRESKIRSLFNDIAGKLSQALAAIRQTKNENYLSVTINFDFDLNKV